MVIYIGLKLPKLKFRSHLFLIGLSLLFVRTSITQRSAFSNGEELHTIENAVTNFRDYVRINTAHPRPDYDSALTWIQKQAKDLSLEYHISRFSETTRDEFGIWLTWHGLNSSLPSLFLYSHVDVVAADSTQWTRNPFSAEMDKDGNIFGRGTQDMKSVAVQYLEAIRSLKAKNFIPTRTIHVGFFPDEEVGGVKGFNRFASTPEFRAMNVGLMLDEGMPNEEPNELNVFYAQRTTNWIKFTAVGKSGHGSLLLNDTASEKLRRVINKLLDFREKEKLRLELNSSLHLGDVPTINLNMLEGGTAPNIIPAKLSASFDIRLPPSWTFADRQKLLDDTCAEAGPNVTYQILFSLMSKDNPNAVTQLGNGFWWWLPFQQAIHSMNLTITPRIFPAGVDGQVARQLGIPALGFSPIFNTSMRMHDKDEYLNRAVFIRGIEVYEALIQRLSSEGARFTNSTVTGGSGSGGHGADKNSTKPGRGGKSGASTFRHMSSGWITSALPLLSAAALSLA